MGILKEYMVQILVVATILAIAYLMRKEIMNAFTQSIAGESLEEFEADVETVKTASFSDIWESLKASLPGGYISQEQYRANIAEINRQLGLQ